MRVQLFARVLLSLAPSYRRFVFTTSDLQEIDRNHSGAAVLCQFSECGARCCVIVRVSHVAGVCAVLGGLS